MYRRILGRILGTVPVIHDSLVCTNYGEDTLDPFITMLLLTNCSRPLSRWNGAWISNLAWTIIYVIWLDFSLSTSHLGISLVSAL